MFKVFLKQLQYSLATIRIYVAFIIGIVMQIVSVMPLLAFSQKTNEPLSIFESFIYFSCDDYLMATAFLGIVLLVSDIPFTEQNETYTLLRISRKRWVLGKILYLFCICTIYYGVVMISGMIFISGNSYLGNFWSEPIYTLVTGGAQELAESIGAYFPYNYILLGLTPIMALIVSFSLSVLYGFVMSVLFFYINLKLSHVVSYVIVMMFHVAGYLLISLFYSNYCIKFSLFGNSLLMYHNIGNDPNTLVFLTLPQTYLIDGLFILAGILLIFRTIKKYDFRITVGAKQ